MDKKDLQKEEPTPEELAEFDAPRSPGRPGRPKGSRTQGRLSPSQRKKTREKVRRWRASKRAELRAAELARTPEEIWAANLAKLSEEERAKLMAEQDVWRGAYLNMLIVIELASGKSTELYYVDQAYLDAQDFLKTHPLMYTVLTRQEIVKINSTGNEEIRELFEAEYPSFYRYGYRSRIPRHFYMEFLKACVSLVEKNDPRLEIDSEIASKILAEWASYQPRRRTTAAPPVIDAAEAARLRVQGELKQAADMVERERRKTQEDLLKDNPPPNFQF